MSDVSSSIRRDDSEGIRTLTCANAPINSLGYDLRTALIAELDKAAQDDSVAAVIVTTSGRYFFSGADIRELDDPRSPRVFDLTAHIESLPIPVFAAMHGAALGGGLELALACHARIARSGTRIGFPEINLGLIPGAGGTQYATRLAGPVDALSMICTGKPVSADRALALSLVDAVVDGDPVEHARLMAQEFLQNDKKIMRVRDRDVPEFDQDALDREIEESKRRTKTSIAVPAAIKAVQVATDGSFDAGVKVERDLFEKLRVSPQSRALRYQFLAERRATHVDDVTAQTAVAEIDTVGVIGGGTMGRGIAQAFLTAGFGVTLVERHAQAASKAQAAVIAGLDRDRERGRISEERHGAAVSRFDMRVGEPASVGQVDLVIEAAFEDMATKKEIFTSVAKVVAPGAILATNTSSLDINEIASVTAHPERVVGMHFFSPANVMRLLEVVRADTTSAQTLATVLKVAQRIRKASVVVGVCEGFVGNRMLAQRHIAAERLLLQGALPEQVDRVWVEFGFPMGVFAMTDLAGVDVNWRVRKARAAPLAVHDAVYEMGRYGQKTGAGFFRYEPGKRVPIPDPEIEQLILETSRKAGVVRRDFSDAEILSRLLYPMINEGARLLDEGIARRASDIDVVWVNGYAWPAWRGGPMYYADQVGLAVITKTLREMAAQVGDSTLEPSSLVQRLATAGRSFTG